MHTESELMAVPRCGTLPAPSDLLTVEQVSAWLRIGARTVWRWSKQGLLPAPLQLPGRRTRWSEQAIRQHLEELSSLL